jgi:hypothetical protein
MMTFRLFRRTLLSIARRPALVALICIYRLFVVPCLV